MNRFWEAIIRPIFEILQPKAIVEVGSKDGQNTRNLMEYCRQNNAVLHAIDPLPEFDVEAWQEKYGKNFVFHKSLSLNALPLINRMDVVLIDGDHNWYTVYNELKLIEKNIKKHKQKFPLVMLHDVGWPYGRRDLYYNPENIPPAYLKPYKKMGMRPDSPGLVEKGGLNANLFNSIDENGPQNGVLTAVEDFLKETELLLEFFTLPSFHGMGILFLTELKQNASFLQYMDSLSMAKPLLRMLEQMEKTRVMLDIKKIELALKLDSERMRSAGLAKRLEARDAEISELREWMRKLKEEFQILLSSRRWKIGNSVVNLADRLCFKKKTPLNVDRMISIFSQFESYGKREKSFGHDKHVDYSSEELKQ